MAKPPKRGRISLKEQLQRNHAAMSFYAAGAGKPAPPKPARLVELEARKPRARPTPSGKPLERDVLKAVIQALRLDRRVASVERNQSGVFQDGNRYVRVGSKGKLDLTVYLKGEHAGRYLEIEVKREPNVKLLTEEQRQRIKRIKATGGLAGWCWSVDSALALLP